ncbi:MAG: PP0621 family protein [Nitrospinota bacterium]
MRFLLYLAILYLLWMALAGIFRSLKGGGGRTKALSSEELVQCAQCGTYVPKSDIVRRRGREFCTKECARQFKFKP